MAFKLYENTWETSTTGGTGDLTLAGAVSGWRAFSAQYSNGDTFWYSIADGTGTNFEVGLGTYNSGPNSISRTTVYRSTNSNLAVNFSGTQQVLVAPLGVTLDSLFVPGQTGFPTRSADNTWSYPTAAVARSSTNLNVEGLVTKGDTNYTILATDRVVGTSATLTVNRTWTLPAASAVNPGQSVMIIDLANGVSATSALIVSRAGADVIVSAGGTIATLQLFAASVSVTLISDGVSKWIIPGTAFMVGGSGGAAAATLQIAGGGGFIFQYSGGYQLTLLFSNPTFQWAVYTGGLEVGGSGGLGIGSTKIRLAQGFSTHIEATGTTPTAASNGTAATVVGTDLAGRITVGAVPNTQLTLTFGVAFPNAPICFAQNETTAVTIRATTVGTNSVTFTATGLFVAGDAVSYICMGYY